MKRKLLSLLVLLMTAISCAWAQGYDVTFGGFAAGPMNTTVSVVSLPKSFNKIVGYTPMPFNVFNNGNKFTSVTVTNDGNGMVSAPFSQTNMNITVFGTFEGTATIQVNGVDGDNNDFSANISVTCVAKVPTGYCGAPDVNDGKNVTWLLTSDGVMTISGTGAMADYDDSSDIPWESIKNDITSVVIENGVTSIGNYAFEHCDKLASVSIPASVTSISGYAFKECSNLDKISIPASVTSIGDYAFEHCVKLAMVTIYASSLTAYGEDAFVSIDNLKIYVPEGSGDAYKEGWYEYENLIEEMGVVDSGSCGISGHASDVTWSMTIDGVMTISGTGAMADYDDSSDIPWESIKNDITSVVIENGVTTIGEEAFSYCENLVSVSIPASMTSIGNLAFYGCGNLATVSIPASVTSIGNLAFYGCGNLATVSLESNPFINLSAFPDDATVMMNLTANSAGGAYWTTFYNMHYAFLADANTEVFKVALSDTELTMNKVDNRIVDAGTAVVLKSTGNPVMILTKFTSNDSQTNNLEGVSDPAGKTAASPSTTYVLNHTAANGVGFYRLKSGKTLRVGKGYLTYSGANTREFFGFEEATGLKAIDNGQLTIDNVVYDLQGRRVQNPTKGLYIVNGKKVVIK